MNRMREIRKAKKMTLNEVSQRTGYTKSFISQLERGIKNPSLEALRKISDCLAVPATMLMDRAEYDTANQACYVVTPENRRKTKLSTLSSTVYEMLTPDLGGEGLNGLICEIAPGESCSGKQISHAYAECMLVLEGEATALINDEVIVLQQGSSLYIEKNAMHNIENRTDRTIKLIGFFYA